MRFFKEFQKNLLVEKLTPEQWNSVLVHISDDYKKRYSDWFDGEGRVYLKINQDPNTVNKSTAPEEVSSVVSNLGYKIDDYIEGIASTKDGKRIIKIGKLIQKAIKTKPEDKQAIAAKKIFDERLKGNQTKKDHGNLIVISRMPYDIAGMSTDRAWKSCHDLTGASGDQYRKIPAEIEAGFLIAYEIDHDDLNIQKPYGRVLISVYNNIRDPKDTLLHLVDRTYGHVSTGFRSTVQNWLDSKQGIKAGTFKFSDKYCAGNYPYNDLQPKKIKIAGAIKSKAGSSPLKDLVKNQRGGYINAVENPDVLSEVKDILAKAVPYGKYLKGPSLRYKITDNDSIINILGLGDVIFVSDLEAAEDGDIDERMFYNVDVSNTEKSNIVDYLEDDIRNQIKDGLHKMMVLVEYEFGKATSEEDVDYEDYVYAEFLLDVWAGKWPEYKLDYLNHIIDYVVVGLYRDVITDNYISTVTRKFWAMIAEFEEITGLGVLKHDRVLTDINRNYLPSLPSIDSDYSLSVRPTSSTAEAIVYEMEKAVLNDKEYNFYDDDIYDEWQDYVLSELNIPIQPPNIDSTELDYYNGASLFENDFDIKEFNKEVAKNIKKMSGYEQQLELPFESFIRKLRKNL